MPSCFVVMGYGVKTDFQQNKSFDLDKTYKNIIKPAVLAAGFTCERADEIQHAGVIDVPMYDRLLTADLVIADLSTANVNAFFELGVRYALRPRTTVVIAEKGFKIPFDMGHVVVRHYEHLGSGIDFDEVEKMRETLTTACKAIVAGGLADSPVYTFLSDLDAPRRRAAGLESKRGLVAEPTAQARLVEERTERARQALADAGTKEEKAALSQSMGALMGEAMKARASEKFETMRDLLRGIRAAQGDAADPFVVQQLALATYKAKKPDPVSALLQAKEVLLPLDPDNSSDPETLGLWGAIHKRLWESGAAQEDRLATLDTAIRAHEKGFYLKNDYYNGINLAFLLFARAAAQTGDEAIADRVHSRRVAASVFLISQSILNAGIRRETSEEQKVEEYWVRATAAEALLGLGRQAESEAAFAEACEMAPEPWMATTTAEQLAKLRKFIS